jgi:hypothetical protein
MQVEIQIDDSQVRAQLARMSTGVNRALELAMKDATTYLLARVRNYPPPPPAIQGPANVPVRSFTTRRGANVRLRSNKAGGKGVSFAKASTLRYKRTGMLYRSWSTRIAGVGTEIRGIVGSNGNTAPYNVYVQGPLNGRPAQAAIHRGRWESIDEVRERSAETINRMFQARIDQVTGG